MDFRKYSFADLKALTNEMRQRLDNPTMWAFKEQNIDIMANAIKEIDKRLEALISPVKESKKRKMSEHLLKTILETFNYETGHTLRGFDDKSQRQLEKLFYIENYNVDHFRKAVKSAFADMSLRETVKHLTPEFITRPAQFSKYLNMKDEPIKSLYQPA